MSARTEESLAPPREPHGTPELSGATWPDSEEDLRARDWRRIARAYRQLASGQRLLREGRSELGSMLESAALVQLESLGVEAVYVEDVKGAPGGLGAGSPSSSRQALETATAAVAALPEGSLKKGHLRTLALLRDLAALLDVGDEVLSKALEWLRDPHE